MTKESTKSTDDEGECGFVRWEKVQGMQDDHDGYERRR
jgi:hypothetical protein